MRSANAGITRAGAARRTDRGTLAEILRINIVGPFLAIKHALPHMAPQKYGSIVCPVSAD